MHSVVISLASNIKQEEHLRNARQALREVLLCPVYTDEIWTDPVGMPSGRKYLNQLVEASTTLDAPTLTSRLKEMEIALGRNSKARTQGIVPIDLDLLEHDGCRFHQRDWQRDYVRRLLPMLGKEPDDAEDQLQSPVAQNP